VDLRRRRPGCRCTSPVCRICSLKSGRRPSLYSRLCERYPLFVYPLPFLREVFVHAALLANDEVDEPGARYADEDVDDPCRDLAAKGKPSHEVEPEYTDREPIDRTDDRDDECYKCYHCFLLFRGGSAAHEVIMRRATEDYSFTLSY